MPRHNLPNEATSFVGRAFALTEVRRLLGETRLLTLTGPGGSGKTRLALRAAAETLDSFPGGVWVADLTTVLQADLLPQKVASALGLQEVRGPAPAVSLTRAIGAREVLLVLDNCEHLVEACAALAEDLLAACGGLRLLATSREPLRASGETVWAVPPLALPTFQTAPPLYLLEQVDAVKLFLDRVRARRPGYRLTPEQAPGVVEVCRRLDGLPLAIELAAAQTAALTVEQIAAHLDGMLELLRGGRRTLARHETIRAAIDWSYALLSSTERDLFQRLAVFTGGFRLEAAEAVCSGDPDHAIPVLHDLLRLVDKSLVVAETGGGDTRYRLLEPIRQYAAELLQAAGDLQAVQERHARYYVALAEAAEPWFTSPQRKEWLDRLEPDQDNLRAVFVWSRSLANGTSTAPDGGQLGLRLAGALFWFWFWHGNRSEGLRWAEEALAMAESRLQGAARA
ncbi:MAG: NB-ARC domain-containing protein, partial [Chloroflexota bacterium]